MFYLRCSSVQRSFFCSDVIAITSWAPDVNLVSPIFGDPLNLKGRKVRGCIGLSLAKTPSENARRVLRLKFAILKHLMRNKQKINQLGPYRGYFQSVDFLTLKSERAHIQNRFGILPWSQPSLLE